MRHTQPLKPVRTWATRCLCLLIFWGGLTLLTTGCGEEFSCSVDYDCPGKTEVCVNGSCEPFTCQEDTDCEDPNATCIDNRCETATD